MRADERAIVFKKGTIVLVRFEQEYLGIIVSEGHRHPLVSDLTYLGKPGKLSVVTDTMTRKAKAW